MMDLKGAIAEIKNKDNTETFDKSIHSLQAIVDNLLAHGTYGLAAIKAALDGIAAGVFYGSYGPRNVEVGNDVDFGVMLYDPTGNIITTSEIAPGTYTVHRVRGAVDTEVVSLTASSEAAGRVYMTYNFPATSWQVGDIFYIIFSGIQVTVDSSTTEYPDIYTWGRVVREADISAKIGDSSDLPGSTTLFARLRQIVDSYLADSTFGLSALKTLVDAIEDKLDHTDHGLAALKALIDTIENKLDNTTYGLSALKSLIDAIESKLDDGTYGLSALKALMDAMESKLDDGTHGLAALKALIDAVETKLDDGTTGLAAIKALIDALEGKLDDGTYGLAALKALVDAIEAKLDDGTYGLAALKALVDAIEAKLDDGTSGLAALKALIDAVEAKLDKLAGETPVSGSMAGNWQSGMATSGETGADVVTIGANDTRKKLHSLLLSIHNFAVGAKVTVKLFMQVNGTERKVYQEDFNKGTDPDGLWVVNGTVGIHEVLRVEVQSNRPADNGVALHYDYMLEAM